MMTLDEAILKRMTPLNGILTFCLWTICEIFSMGFRVCKLRTIW